MRFRRGGRRRFRGRRGKSRGFRMKRPRGRMRIGRRL